MVEPEQFYNQVFDQFNRINDKIDKNQEHNDGKLTDLCDRMGNMEKNWATHMAILDTTKGIKSEQKTTNNNRFYVITGAMGVFFAAFESIKGYIMH